MAKEDHPFIIQEVIDTKGQKAWEQHVFEDSVQEIALEALSNEAIVLVVPIPGHMQP